MRSLGGRLAITLCLLVTGCASNPAQEAPQIQRISAEELERLLPKPDPKIGYEELVRRSREGVPPDTLIEQIRQSGSSYALTPAQAVELAKQGVDPRVLDAMQAAREQALRDSFAEELGRREREYRQQLQMLQRELLMRPYYYDPFWGPYPPYWRYPYPHYRRR